jgi:hypothetical protein
VVSAQGGSVSRLVEVPDDLERIVGTHNLVVRSMRIILPQSVQTEQKGVLEIGE